MPDALDTIRAARVTVGESQNRKSHKVDAYGAGAMLDRMSVRARLEHRALRKTIVLLMASLLLLGVSTTEECSGGDAVAFEEILVGDFRPFHDGPSDLVIRNERQWCEFWGQAHGIRTEPPRCDRSLVDFRHEVVIASAITGPSGCYTIDITHIEAVQRGRGALRVFTRDTVPGPNCICTLSLVFRVKAVVVSKPVGRVVFIHDPATLECGER